MSGDVQPRKRKEKRRKKDELGIEELRGTAAVFGEGDVLIHSYHEHGTGGHWCAKIIFFSLLAVLVTLIGLIILENRGLSELEANAVESRYSGVLDGWIEDAPYDDHHDEHTLELKHHDYKKIHDDDNDDEHHVSESAHNEDDDHSEEHMHEDEEENTSIEDDADEETEESDDVDDDQDEDDNNGSEDEDVEAYDNEDDQNIEYKKYYKRDIYGENNNNFQEERDENSEEDLKNDIENYDEDDDDGDDIDENKSDEIRNNNDNYENEDIEQNLRDYEDDIDENFDTDDKDSEIEDTDENAVEKEEEISEEIEKIEREVLDEEEVPISDEVTYRYEDKITDKEDFKEDENEDDSSFEDAEMTEQPIDEQITAPSSKPFVELEDETSAEKPTNTLDEEEEYEKRQEQLRLEKEESSSKIWLKLVVGGALLVATHAVIRRSTAPRDTAENEANARQEETPPVIDRRMTLIHTNESIPQQPHYEPPHEEQVKKITSDTKIVQSVPIQKQESEEDQEVSKKFETEEVITEEATNDVLDKELYSDDDDEEVDDEEIIEEKKEYPKESSLYDDKDQEESETEEVPDDVEIIDDEQIEEEIEEEVEDEEDISDVDDAELLSRLEAKYGRLPEPDRPELKHKDGGNSVEDEWPGEPSDPYWRQQLDYAEQEIRQGEWAAANGRLAGGALGGSGRARWLAARALDAQAEARRDNALLTRAVSAYLHLLKMNEQLSDTKLLEVAARALDRIQFRGTYLSAEPVYRLLIRRFPNEVSYRNNLTISFLMANRADLAESVLKETLKIWPNDRVALAHYGFVLKTHYNKLEEAVTLFHKALENDTGPACEPRFYYHLGDALLLLGRFEEAHEVHKRGAKHGHFLSPVQRSLYNVERLKSRPWWRVDETPYVKLARALEKSWKNILKEGEAARALYEKEKEGLKEKGEWSQLDLFVRGQEIPGRCKRAPVTCSIVKTEPAAANCRRGQIKFSSMEPGTHVRPHVGPTNCRLRMHLGLSNTKDTYIRVDQETRQWQTGKVLVFDDSFEHEVWHNGTGTRLVLIVDVWHPHLTPAERRQLPAI